MVAALTPAPSLMAAGSVHGTWVVLNAATPYGAVSGSTQGSNYLSAAAAFGGAPSTTTITFDDPTRRVVGASRSATSTPTR